MWIVNIVSGALLLLVGFLTRTYNLSGLVAGYNTAPEEEKQKYDEKKMTRYVGNLLMISAGVLLVFGFASVVIELPGYLFGVSWGLFTAFIFAGLIYLNTGNRLKKQ